MRRPLADCRLYAFVDTGYLRGRRPVEVARALIDGGVDVVQLRAKGAAEADVEQMAAELMPVVSEGGAWFVVNDFPGVAARVGAPLCHLGQEDFFGAGYRTISDLPGVGGDLKVGLSSHAPDEAARAVAAGAVYVAVGPVYATGTKPGRPGVTLDYVRWAAQNLKLPWFAIGGIHRGNLDEVIKAGARRVCLVSDILNDENPAGACRTIRRILESVPLDESA